MTPPTITTRRWHVLGYPCQSITVVVEDDGEPGYLIEASDGAAETTVSLDKAGRALIAALQSALETA